LRETRARPTSGAASAAGCSFSCLCHDMSCLWMSWRTEHTTWREQIVAVPWYSLRLEGSPVMCSDDWNLFQNLYVHTYHSCPDPVLRVPKNMDRKRRRSPSALRLSIAHANSVRRVGYCMLSTS